MQLSTLLLTLAIILAVCSSVRADDEATGDITGWVDGEASTWIVQHDSTTPSAVFTTLTPGLHQIRIHAYENERFSREGSLYLEIVIQDGDVYSTQIHYFPFPPRHPRFSYGPDHGSGQLTLHSLDVQADRARLSASFAGELHYHQSPNTRPIPHRTRPIRINIDLSAVRD